MSGKKHTINDLFTDSGPFDEAEVVKAILPFVTIQKSTHNIFFKGGRLSTVQKILVYGLAKKLLRSKAVISSELITALELHKKTGIKKGSIDPSYKSLRTKGFLVGKKEYEIPTHKIQSVIKMLQDKRGSKS